MCVLGPPQIHNEYYLLSGSGCFYTDNSTRKGGTVQRGLPRELFEQNEVDGYRTGRPQEPLVAGAVRF